MVSLLLLDINCQFHLLKSRQNLEIMVSITTLSFLNLFAILIFALMIKTETLEKFLSKIGNLRAKKLARKLKNKK